VVPGFSVSDFLLNFDGSRTKSGKPSFGPSIEVAESVGFLFEDVLARLCFSTIDKRQRRDTRIVVCIFRLNRPVIPQQTGHGGGAKRPGSRSAATLEFLS
jgi:hypothetical protein